MFFSPTLANISRMRLIIAGLVLTLLSCQETNTKETEHRAETDQVEIWTVDSLNIPKCELCEELHMDLNKLFGEKISINYRCQKYRTPN